MTIRTKVATSLVVLTLLAAIPLGALAHFGLQTSAPEAGAVVPAPNEVVLTFTQEPQEGTVQIGILEAEDAGVHVMDAVQKGDDPRSFGIVLHGSLAPATYTVSWRGMGQDGHVVRDTFEFTVGGQ